MTASAKSSIAALNAARLYTAIADDAEVSGNTSAEKTALNDVLVQIASSSTGLKDTDLKADNKIEQTFLSDRAALKANALLKAGLLKDGDGVPSCQTKDRCLEQGIAAYERVSTPGNALKITWAKAKSDLAKRRGTVAGVETAIAALKSVMASGDVASAEAARAQILAIADTHKTAQFYAEARNVAARDGTYAKYSLAYAKALAGSLNTSTQTSSLNPENICGAANAYLEAVQASGLTGVPKAEAYEGRGNALVFLSTRPSTTCQPKQVTSGLQQTALNAFKAARELRNKSASGMSAITVENFATLATALGESKPSADQIYREARMTSLNPNLPHPHLESGKRYLAASGNVYSSDAQAALEKASRLASNGNKYPKVAAEANFLMSKNLMLSAASASAVRHAESAAQMDPKPEYLNQACKSHLYVYGTDKAFAGDAYCNTLTSSDEGALLKAMMLYRKAQIDHRKNNAISAFRIAEDAFAAATSGSAYFYGPKGARYQSADVKEFGKVIARNCGSRSGADVIEPSESAERAKQLFKDLGLYSCK